MLKTARLLTPLSYVLAALFSLVLLHACTSTSGVSLAEKATDITCQTDASQYAALGCLLLKGDSTPEAPTLKYALCMRGKTVAHETKMIACMADGQIPPSL